MIAPCAHLLARLRRAFDPVPAALGLAAALQSDIRRLQAAVAEARAAIAALRQATPPPTRRPRSRKPERVAGAYRHASAQH
jgi:hypothetical protein